jgi:hypothetical protein
MSDDGRPTPGEMNGQELIDALRSMAGDFRIIELDLQELGVDYSWDRGNEICWYAAYALESLDAMGNRLADKIVTLEYENRRLQKRNEELRGAKR